MASTAHSQSHLAPCNRLVLQRTCNLSPFRSQPIRRAQQHRRCILKAGLEPDALLAVTQQSLIFAAVVGGEAWLSRQALAPGTTGRPNITPTAISAGTVAAAVAVTQLGGVGQQVGLVIGGVSTFAQLVNYGKRFVDTPDDPSDWPGPKVWPFTMVLLTFFATWIFWQALARTF